MPKFSFKGLDEYIIMLERLAKDSEDILYDVVIDGAKVVADDTKAALQSLPTDDSKFKIGVGKKSISTIQKQGLIESFGVTPFQKKGDFLNVKTGVDGYNRIGQANVTIARRLENGTSWMPKNPVISRATRKARKNCEKAMQERLNKEINKRMK